MVDRIFRKLNRFQNDLIFSSGIGASLTLKQTPHTILMYHGVNQEGKNQFNGRHTAQRDFIRHIRFLKKHAEIISLEDFFEGRFIEGRPNFAITLDDGYRNNYLFAKPVLEEARVPATFFITGLNEVNQNILWADFLNIASKLTQENISIEGENFENVNGIYHSLDTGKNLYEIIKNEKANSQYKLNMISAFNKMYDFRLDKSYDHCWKLMTDDEIRHCGASEFIEVGSHASMHNNLSSISFELAKNELIASRNYLESLMQQPLLSLGYPDGSYSREVITAAEQLGFNYQVAAEGFNFREDETDSRIRDRVGIYSVYSCANQLMAHF
jgi:peptidoglycan/xylan/chitin deacetylase (PgdA/CDA1 family)